MEKGEVRGLLIIEIIASVMFGLIADIYSVATNQGWNWYCLFYAIVPSVILLIFDVEYYK